MTKQTNEKKHDLSLHKNMLSGTILAIGSTLILFVSYPIYLKNLGAEMYGLWAALTIILAFSNIGRLGLDLAIIKYVSEEFGNKDLESIKGYFNTALFFLLGVGLIIFGTIFILKIHIINLLKIPQEYFNLANNLVPPVALISLLVFCIEIINGTLKGLGRFDLANYYYLTGKAISVILALILFQLDLKIWALYLGNLVMYLIIGLLASYKIYKQIGFILSIKNIKSKYLKELIGFGGVITASSIISMLLIPFNKAIISRFIGLSEVTYFEIASRAILRLRALWEHAIRVIMPEISRIKSKNKDFTEISNKILKKTFQLIFFTGLPTFLILFFIAPLFFQFWLKGQFSAEIGIIFKILLIGYFINLISIPFYYYFMAIGKISYCFMNHLTQALSNFLVISILIYLSIYNLLSFSIVYSGAIAFGAITIILLFLKHKHFNFKQNEYISPIKRKQ